MLHAPGTCTRWHKDPRPMLRPAHLNEGGPQHTVWPRRMVDVLCDDGQWHVARLECWHHGLQGWECLISYNPASYHEYSGWYGYSPAALRLSTD